MQGIPDFKEFRMKLVTLESEERITEVLAEIKDRYEAEMA